jgi:hypothetical protein
MGAQIHRIGARGPRFACTFDGIATVIIEEIGLSTPA